MKCCSIGKMSPKGVLVTSAVLYLLVATVQPAAVIEAPKAEQGSADWWKRATFYQIYPRSFKDSNNDGIGDLQGIISKLPHLKDAGITAAWLSPIYKSPQVDQGYDISNFTDIDSQYGTLDDFDDLIKEARKLQIKIVMDFVPNHSSDEHDWFIRSEKNESDYRDFYIWKKCGTSGESPPNNWISIFKYSAWKYSAIRGECYLHQFAEAQPDLNYRNPTVVQNMKDVLKFWLDRGVDGFRMDAVPYIFEDDRFLDEPPSGAALPSTEHGSLKHIYTSDVPETLNMIYEWRDYIDKYTKDNGGDARVMMTEAYTDIKNTMLYYGNSEREGAHFTFNFQIITKLSSSSIAKDIVAAITEWLVYMPLKYTPNWVLGNHDNFRVATRFGPDNVDGFNMLTALLPGVLVTYNGEEIGQENGEVTWSQGKDPNACNGNESDFDKISRDFERTPFHWDDTTNAGFNDGFKPWLPLSVKYLKTNLKAQSDASVLSHYQIYKQLIALRKEPTLASGEFQIKALSDNVLAYVRTLDESDAYVYAFNIGNQAETVDLTVAFPKLSSELKIVLTSGQSTHKKGEMLSTAKLTLKAHESIIGTAAEAETPTQPPAETTTNNSVKISISLIMLVTLISCTVLIGIFG